MKKLSLILAALALVSLTGCIDRTQADAKLARGCEAGVNTMLEKGDRIGKVVKTEFTPATEGPGMRHVTLTATIKDDWSEEEQTYECVFEEDFGFMNTNYAASIYQIKAGDKTVGKSGNEIMGDAEDFIKLNDAIRQAMYRD